MSELIIFYMFFYYFINNLLWFGCCDFDYRIVILVMKFSYDIK